MSIHEKMIGFQKSVKTIKKSGFNRGFKAEYSTLDDILTAALPALHSNGLYLRHFTHSDERGNVLVTTVTDAEGDSISTELPIPELRDPQQLISYLTYAKRANTSALLSLGGDLDDDGNQAAAAVAQTEAPALSTPEQDALIAEYIEAGQVPAKTLAWLEKKGKALTEKDADKLINKIKAAKE